MQAQVFGAGRGDRNQLASPRLAMPHDEAAVVGVLPDGQAGQDVRHTSMTSS